MNIGPGMHRRAGPPRAVLAFLPGGSSGPPRLLTRGWLRTRQVGTAAIGRRAGAVVYSGMGSVTFSTDSARGSWILPRLGGWHTMGGVVPQGFDAYARIFHPGDAQYLSWTNGEAVSAQTAKLRWRELAALRGTVSHPLMQWTDILAGHKNPARGQDGWQYGNASLGGLPEDEFAAVTAILARHTEFPSRCMAGLWDGWGSLPKEIIGDARFWPHLALPNRNYLLFDAPLDAFVDPDWPSRNGWPSHQTPNQLWPADHSWFLAAEIDFDSTVVGGSSQLISALVDCEDLEALRIPATASLASTADTINAPR